MAGKTSDRRIRYTKMVLRESLIGLLQEKPVSKISITELCEAADLNRATFYAHYNDQFDLLHQMEQEIMDDIDRYIQEMKLDQMEPSSPDTLVNVLAYIRKEKTLFHTLLNKNQDLGFQTRVMVYIGQKHFSSFPDAKMQYSQYQEYIFLFFASGAIAIIKKWLEDGALLSDEEVSKLILDLSLHGRSLFDSM